MQILSGLWLTAAGTVLVWAYHANAQSQVATVNPFTTVQVCLPFNTLISPSPTGSYDVLVNADEVELQNVFLKAVKNALRAGVDAAGVLTLVASGEFATNNSIQVTVRCPANALKGVTTSSSVGAEVVVKGPFSTSDSFAVTNNGATTLSVLNLTAPSITVNNPGAGTFLLEGNIGSVTLTNTGAGTAYISGVTQSVTLNIGGVGNVFIDAANSNVAIKGQAGAASLASVTFNRGQCQVTSSYASIFGSPCKQAAVTIPSRAVYWTCGITLKGSFGCQGSSGSIYGSGGASSGSTTSTSSSGSGSSASSSVTSSSASPGGFSQTTTSTDGVTQTTQTSDGQTITTINGQQVNTATTQCTSNAAQSVLAQI